MNYFNMGNEYYNKNDYARAINLYRKSIENKENEAPSLYNSAVCHIKLMNFMAAIPLLKCALKIKKDSRYYFNLAYCYSQLKDDKKALLYFNTAWALDPFDADCEKAINLIIERIKK
ncbi:tetratricopeptide repeat protein [Clostridium cellulovorans]|uniref:Tetratricopeptide TPR_1 repeat-containing protein n=1 Tax=Clostridium cellulovorans (strain ATCC 35296 / DSM 3052 / OCM 3 / 743B) TaxID=573061 RepID=D9SLW8_CLOC7|nr:tetratricopeptide repeat protein [Clostridium cellulovorans]ADL51699.1 Tetratricopeptide TPR_1 repeat-containing protein [Clostridium cellulovorans 743B]